MGATASQITSLTIVYSTVYSDADQIKHQSSASLAFVWGIHRGPVNSPHKWPATRKMFPFDDVIMTMCMIIPIYSSCSRYAKFEEYQQLFDFYIFDGFVFLQQNTLCFRHIGNGVVCTKIGFVEWWRALQDPAQLYLWLLYRKYGTVRVLHELAPDWRYMLYQSRER